MRRTTIELDEELVRAAQSATGETLRATVERGLRAVVADAESAAEQKRWRVRRHLELARAGIDADILMSGDAWR